MGLGWRWGVYVSVRETGGVGLGWRWGVYGETGGVGLGWRWGVYECEDWGHGAGLEMGCVC